jgi:hypothetical protein
VRQVEHFEDRPSKMTGSRDLPPLNVPFFPKIFFRNQFRAKVRYPPKGTTLSGKVAIVTGSNTGAFSLRCVQDLVYRV